MSNAGFAGSLPALPDARIKPDGARESSPGCDIDLSICNFGNAREALSEED
jgi:hypothetical protein